MLHIQFGEMENVNYGPDWFKANYDPAWLKNEFVRAMIKDVDNSDYVDGIVINSPILGSIPPERLSGGVQTLIMIYEKPQLKTLLGDVDCDGKVDITDITTLAISLVDKKPLTGQAAINADVDGDGSVALTDLARIKQFVSKVIDKL